MAETGAVSGSSNNNPVQTTTKKNSDLGKNDFLKLLVTQLRFQDPMNPMEDKEFIAQMAQFSSLEEMQNLSKTLSQQAELGQLSQASGLIGKKVAVRTDDAHFAGQVVEARRVDGAIKLMVKPDGEADGALVPVEIQHIEQIA
ncbi:MAG TPA: flagellar hook capping FlgD N-terminal domain-containing protein [Pantanalinema sp.]